LWRAASGRPYGLEAFLHYLWGGSVVDGKAVVNVEIDNVIAEKATQLLEQMGMSLTTAIEAFFRQIIAEKQLPFHSSAAQTYGERLHELVERKGIPTIVLPADENGHAFIDKDKYPDLYDWAVNG